MFKIKIKPQILKEFSAIMGVLTKEFKLEATKKGIEAVGVDTGHVGMVSLKLGKDAFIEYETDNHEFGINLEKLNPIMKLSTHEDIGLEYDEKESRMIITIGNLRRTMGLINAEEMQNIKVPTPELAALVTLSSPSELLRGIKAASDISDRVGFSLTKEFFMLTAEGDTDNIELKIPKEDLVSIDIDKNNSALYSIDPLQQLINNIPTKESVAIGFETDKPMRAIFRFADGKGVCTFMMGTRVESE
jgi:proliferating cell nuclear antigen